MSNFKTNKRTLSSELSACIQDAGNTESTIYSESYFPSPLVTHNQQILSILSENPHLDTDSEDFDESSEKRENSPIDVISDLFPDSSHIGSDDGSRFSPSPNISSDLDKDEPSSSKMIICNLKPPANKKSLKDYKRGMIDILEFFKKNHFITNFIVDHPEINHVSIIPTPGILPSKKPSNKQRDQNLLSKETQTKTDVGLPENIGRSMNTSPTSKSEYNKKLNKKTEATTETKIMRIENQKTNTSTIPMEDNKTRSTESTHGSDVIKTGKTGKETTKLPQDTTEIHKKFKYLNMLNEKVTIKTSDICKNCKVETRKNAKVYLNHLCRVHADTLSLVKSLIKPI